MRYISSMAECHIESPLLNVVSMFTESDLFSEWMPGVTECKVQHVVTPHRMMIGVKMQMPWPMSHRDCVCKCAGLVDSDKIACMSIIKSLPE